MKYFHPCKIQYSRWLYFSFNSLIGLSLWTLAAAHVAFQNLDPVKQPKWRSELEMLNFTSLT